MLVLPDEQCSKYKLLLYVYKCALISNTFYCVLKMVAVPPSINDLPPLYSGYSLLYADLGSKEREASKKVVLRLPSKSSATCSLEFNPHEVSNVN